nr:hypothetical protein [uncultured Draconibacterium sp.]
MTPIKCSICNGVFFDENSKEEDAKNTVITMNLLFIKSIMSMNRDEWHPKTPSLLRSAIEKNASLLNGNKFCECMLRKQKQKLEESRKNNDIFSSHYIDRSDEIKRGTERLRTEAQQRQIEYLIARINKEHY